ncbi:MAG: thioredoxin domain-containing protein [Pseudoflavonifractor sp.]|nr:thioredoxin domain-containing protein [Alloprevotella sp.]MCM1116096.1 thioredoxin domain-containing protein [Pseudoflavonifractor sp.]
MALEFTDASVKEAIESGKPVVIDFWATWCGPCMGMAPVFAQIADEYSDKDIVIGKYNIDENTELATECRIMSIPAFLFFKDGKNIRELRLAGSQTPDTLRANINKLLAL